MFNILFLLFVVVPIVEIALLINVGDMIGGWNTLALVIATAFVGAYLVRNQGVNTLLQAQRKMQMGSLPKQEMVEGLLLAVSGVLLVTPGFVTDALGLLFAMPFSRPVIARYLHKQFVIGTLSAGQQQWQRQSQSHNHAQSDIIEGEFVRTDADSNQSDANKLHKPD